MNKVVISILLLSAFLILWILLLGNKTGVTSGSPVGEYYTSEGTEHLPEGTKIDYKTNPPTSGNHYAKEAKWGVYTIELSDEQLVHNLEHGGVNVFYQADKISSADLEKLTALVKGYRSKVVLAPRIKNDSLIALASWEYLSKLDSFDEQKISQFLKNNRNHAPEQVPD